jgi:hypothetical protein
MHLVDEIFRDFKEFGYIEELKKIKSLKEKFDRIEKIVSRVNVLKAEITDLTLDEQLYLDYLLQEKGIDLELCSDFYVFFSNKNNKFHCVCKSLERKKTTCCGDKKKCAGITQEA